MYQYYTQYSEYNTIINNIDWHAIIFQQAQLNEVCEPTSNYLQTTTHMRPTPAQPEAPTVRDTFLLNRIYTIITQSNINPDEHYYHFTIPKTTGGVRPIDAPDDQLRQILKQIRYYFEVECRVLPHNAAFAYFPTRSIKNALEVHQKNESNWFGKLDMSNFFPSITTQVLVEQLTKLYPFYTFKQDEKLLQQFTAVCKFCTLHDRLPQGAETSPLLSNLVMVPFDYHMTNWAYKCHYRYTRYADDIIISNQRKFDINTVTEVINNLLQGLHYPLQINNNKTRYGSRSGQNWNLGLMLNQQNNITLGHKKKECLRAALNNFLKDWTNQQSWDTMATSRLMGELNYLYSIEPDYATRMFTKIQDKYNVSNWRDIAIQILKQ